VGEQSPLQPRAARCRQGLRAPVFPLNWVFGAGTPKRHTGVYSATACTPPALLRDMETQHRWLWSHADLNSSERPQQNSNRLPSVQLLLLPHSSTSPTHLSPQPQRRCRTPPENGEVQNMRSASCPFNSNAATNSSKQRSCSSLKCSTLDLKIISLGQQKDVSKTPCAQLRVCHLTKLQSLTLLVSHTWDRKYRVAQKDC